MKQNSFSLFMILAFSMVNSSINASDNIDSPYKLNSSFSSIGDSFISMADSSPNKREDSRKLEKILEKKFKINGKDKLEVIKNLKNDYIKLFSQFLETMPIFASSTLGIRCLYDLFLKTKDFDPEYLKTCFEIIRRFSSKITGMELVTVAAFCLIPNENDLESHNRLLKEIKENFSIIEKIQDDDFSFFVYSLLRRKKNILEKTVKILNLEMADSRKKMALLHHELYGINLN